MCIQTKDVAPKTQGCPEHADVLCNLLMLMPDLDDFHFSIQVHRD